MNYRCYVISFLWRNLRIENLGGNIAKKNIVSSASSSSETINRLSILLTIKRTLIFFSQKLIVCLISRDTQSITYESGSALKYRVVLCNDGLQFLMNLFNDGLHTITRYFTKTVASYSPVLLTYNKTIKAIF